VIWLVTGVPGAGKTSVCAALAQRRAPAIHLETDMMDEHALHRHGAADDRIVARRAYARLARELAVGGTDVFVDDTLETDAERRAYTDCWRAYRLVLLAPTLAVALARNAARTNKEPGDAPVLAAIARRLYAQMRAAHRDAWLIVDSSRLTIAQTVDRIVARR
jgi:predicted kinase